MKLIVVEGVRGVGKDTFAEVLADELRSEGVNVIMSTEPTEGLYGGRALFRTSRGYNDVETSLLFFLDRKTHIEDLKKICPPDGIAIIVRYSLSTYVYQDDKSLTEMLHKRIDKPDFTVLLDSDFDTWKGINSRSSSTGDRAKLRSSDMDEERYTKYRKLYMDGVKSPNLTKKYVVINAFNDVSKMVEKVWVDMLELIGK